jgi:hypothetical protein
VTLNPGAPPPIQAHSAYCIVYSNPVTRIVTHLDGQLFIPFPSTYGYSLPPSPSKRGAYPLPNLLSTRPLILSIILVNTPVPFPFSPIRVKCGQGHNRPQPGHIKARPGSPRRRSPPSNPSIQYPVLTSTTYNAHHLSHRFFQRPLRRRRFHPSHVHPNHFSPSLYIVNAHPHPRRTR